jgi:predicted enzyme related to lactoylglutathione lyase
VEAAGVRIGFSSASVGRELFGIATAPGENTEVVLWCADVDELHRKALDAGGESLTSPADPPDGRLRCSWLRDPEGHRVKLVQERTCTIPP